MDVNTKVGVELSVGEWQAHLTLLQSATTLVVGNFAKALNAAVEQVAMQKMQELQKENNSEEGESFSDAKS